MINRVIISGGGTAGHIYPALAVAQELRERGVEILFVGALGKMEIERVPKAGFRIVGLPIAGLQRRLTLRNLLVPLKMLKSMAMARRIIKDFNPDVVVGFGGYASAPVLRTAQRLGVRTVIQEQNSYAGLTNKMLAKRADKICTAYEGMERFFAPEKIVLTGNPLRIKFEDMELRRAQGYLHFGLKATGRTILLTGGSLGTRTLNEAMMGLVNNGQMQSQNADIQIIWQTGSYYHSEMESRVKSAAPGAMTIVSMAFIERMDLAYAVADVVVCRAGASTVSEIELLGKAAVFVPSPNVAEDHQTKNARNLADRGAALMVADSEAQESLLGVAFALLRDEPRLSLTAAKAKLMGRAEATRDVADVIMQKV
ncbi:MAG: undecaprenyldiphospho-muramoylpentapeptide beta-N-acetylglucosaminyltransferase [Mucinivorans sp.]